MVKKNWSAVSPERMINFTFSVEIGNNKKGAETNIFRFAC